MKTQASWMRQVQSKSIKICLTVLYHSSPACFSPQRLRSSFTIAGLLGLSVRQQTSFGRVMQISLSSCDSKNACSTSIPSISQSKTAARFRIMHRDRYLAVGAQVSSKSLPKICEYPHATRRTLYLIVPFGRIVLRKTNFDLIGFTPSGIVFLKEFARSAASLPLYSSSSTSSQVCFKVARYISNSQAFFQCSLSFPHNASIKFMGIVSYGKKGSGVGSFDDVESVLFLVAAVCAHCSGFPTGGRSGFV